MHAAQGASSLAHGRVEAAAARATRLTGAVVRQLLNAQHRFDVVMREHLARRRVSPRVPSAGNSEAGRLALQQLERERRRHSAILLRGSFAGAVTHQRQHAHECAQAGPCRRASQGITQARVPCALGVVQAQCPCALPAVRAWPHALRGRVFRN